MHLQKRWILQVDALFNNFHSFFSRGKSVKMISSQVLDQPRENALTQIASIHEASPDYRHYSIKSNLNKYQKMDMSNWLDRSGINFVSKVNMKENLVEKLKTGAIWIAYWAVNSITLVCPPLFLDQLLMVLHLKIVIWIFVSLPERMSWMKCLFLLKFDACSNENVVG